MSRWDDGSGYETYMGRWSRGIARAFVEWLGVGPGAGWLDVGCGTGALAATIASTAQPRRIVGVDPSEAFLGTVHRTLGGSVEVGVADARALPFRDGEFEVAASGLVLNFVPESETAVREMRRVTVENGWAAAYVWDYAEGMEMLRYFWDAVISLDPAAEQSDEGIRFPLCRPPELRALFAGAGLDVLRVGELVVPTEFAGFDDYWTPFLGGQGPAPGYVASLGGDGRDRLREHLRELLPVSDGGTIALKARAWAIEGRR